VVHPGYRRTRNVWYPKAIGDKGKFLNQLDGVYRYIVSATGFSHSPSIDNCAVPLTILVHILHVDLLERSKSSNSEPRHGSILGISEF